MKNDLPAVCYWCGAPLNGENKEREHVPPLGFFPKGYRENLMTVPSCKDHNSAFSALDEEFQLYIKSVAKSPISVADFKDRTVKSLERKEAKSFVERFGVNTFYANIDGEKTLVVRVDGLSFLKFFEKVIRGLYFYHNGRPAVGVVQGVSPLFSAHGFYLVAFSQNMLKEFNGLKGSNAVGVVRGDYHNSQIFNYEYLNIPEHNFFLVFMYFHDCRSHWLGRAYQLEIDNGGQIAIIELICCDCIYDNRYQDLRSNFKSWHRSSPRGLQTVFSLKFAVSEHGWLARRIIVGSHRSYSVKLPSNSIHVYSCEQSGRNREIDSYIQDSILSPDGYIANTPVADPCLLLV